MPPPPEPVEDAFWTVALAVVRGRAAVVSADTRYDYHEREYDPREYEYGGRRAPGRFIRGRPSVSVDLSVLIDERVTPDDSRQTQLAVAAALAERVGMRLVPVQSPSPPPRPTPIASISEAVRAFGSGTATVPAQTVERRVEIVFPPAAPEPPPPPEPKSESGADDSTIRFRMLELD